jgi:pyruvate formate lyase activating enzyme
MQFIGIQPCSLVDWPGHPCVTVFTQGCNMRCYYCHNNFGNSGTLLDYMETVEEIIASPLDYVIISGGEPTIHNDLPEFVHDLRYYHKKVGIHTNGTNLGILKKCQFDYIAMDIKAPWDKYELVTSSNLVPKLETIEYVKSLPHTFRCTLNKHLTDDDVQRMIDIVGPELILQKEN